MAEERSSKLEDGSIEISKSEEKRKSKKNELSLREMGGIINFTNVMFNDSRGRRGERCIKRIRGNNSCKLPKFDERSNLHTQEAQQTM